jgi:hypothetical protein
MKDDSRAYRRLWRIMTPWLGMLGKDKGLVLDF